MLYSIEKEQKKLANNHKSEKMVLYNRPPLPASAQTPIRCSPSCWRFRWCTAQAAAYPAQADWCNLCGHPLKWCSTPVTPEPSWRTPVEKTQTQGLKVTSVLQESYDSSYTANSRFSYHLPIRQNNLWVESPNMVSKRNQRIKFFLCSASQWSNILMGTLVVVVESLSHIRLFLWPCALEPARLFCPRDFPGKNTRLGCHFLSKMFKFSAIKIETYVPFDVGISPLEIYPCRKHWHKQSKIYYENVYWDNL